MTRSTDGCWHGGFSDFVSQQGLLFLDVRRTTASCQSSSSHRIMIHKMRSGVWY